MTNLVETLKTKIMEEGFIWDEDILTTRINIEKHGLLTTLGTPRSGYIDWNTNQWKISEIQKESHKIRRKNINLNFNK